MEHGTYRMLWQFQRREYVWNSGSNQSLKSLSFVNAYDKEISVDLMSFSRFVYQKIKLHHFPVLPNFLMCVRFCNKCNSTSL